MDLKDYIKQQQEQLAKLQSELAERQAAATKNPEAPALSDRQAEDLKNSAAANLPPPTGPEMFVNETRNAEVVKAEIHEVRNSIAAAEHTLNTSFADKAKDLGKEFLSGQGPEYEAMIDGLKALKDHTVNSPEAVGKLVEAGVNTVGTHLGLDVGEAGKIAGEFTTAALKTIPKMADVLAVEASMAADKVVDGARELGSKTAEMANKLFQDAGLTPSAEQLEKVAALGEKQEMQTIKQEEAFATARKAFDGLHKDDPVARRELDEKLDGQADRMRVQREAQQLQEIKQELQIGLIQINPLGPTL